MELPSRLQSRLDGEIAKNRSWAATLHCSLHFMRCVYIVFYWACKSVVMKTFLWVWKAEPVFIQSVHRHGCFTDVLSFHTDSFRDLGEYTCMYRFLPETFLCHETVSLGEIDIDEGIYTLWSFLG